MEVIVMEEYIYMVLFSQALAELIIKVLLEGLEAI